METTLYDSENSHTETQPFLKIKIRIWNQIGTTFSGPSVSKILNATSQGPQEGREREREGGGR